MRSREFFKSQSFEGAEGPYEYVGPMWKFSETPVEFYQPPVRFGEHNDYVYRDILKVDDAEFERLKAAGHVATTYDPSVP